ncbi:lipoyl(octanoyl) transferase [Paraperlucidibaca baekdonensis]|uniref:Octanoyltransferase n=1 Tax=Paraperlucidibaca baekdonensis TaxID=748120 RepID=A0A3E0HA95_9GAMM|nr:lipoyl(octanoyl) transferase LipB [Paraperlucidibaca baekdonensis]REH40460.1 lipoyl(octanoyl) transferase [Paraperlucidibaca baekdonensis]
MTRACTVWHLGVRDYADCYRDMKAFTEARTETCNDQLWLLQHTPVYTQGQAGKPEHVLLPGSIPLVQSDRGGQVTYHGPGQLVGYLLLDIDRLTLSTRAFVERVEDALAAAIQHFGIAAEANREAHGVYVHGRKMASLGLRIRRGRSYHGFSLNVAMDMQPFLGINPCGYVGLEMCQLRDELGPDHPARALSDADLMSAVEAACLTALSQYFPELDLSRSEQR